MIGETRYYRGLRLRRLWEYVLGGGSRAVVLESNLFWERGTAKHLAVALAGGEQIYLHASISFPMEDEIDQEGMRRIGRDYLVRYLGYCRHPDIERRICQVRFHGDELEPLEEGVRREIERNLDEWGYGIIEHRDTGHRHIHLVLDCQNIVTGRVSVLSQWNAQRLMELILRQMEREYGLRCVELSWVVREREGRRGVRLSSYYAKRIGRDGLRYIKEVVGAGVEASQSWEELMRYCQERGIQIRREGEEIYYHHLKRETYVRSGQLGEAYSVEGIERRWYERQRQTGKDAPAYKAI